MEKEVVWVFGTSASGKETYINGIVEEGKHADKFEYHDKKIAFAKSSIENIGHFDNDPILQKRTEIIEEVKNLLRNNDVVLIKWQFTDSEAGRVEALKTRFPDAKHKIVVLETSDADLSERLRKKPWWTEGDDTQKWIDEERELLAKELKKYNDFEKIILNLT